MHFSQIQAISQQKVNTCWLKSSPSKRSYFKLQKIYLPFLIFIIFSSLKFIFLNFLEVFIQFSFQFHFATSLCNYPSSTETPSNLIGQSVHAPKPLNGKDGVFDPLLCFRLQKHRFSLLILIRGWRSVQAIFVPFLFEAFLPAFNSKDYHHTLHHNIRFLVKIIIWIR